MRALISLLAVLFMSYFLVLFPFMQYINSKPYDEKLGYLPRKELVGCLSADHKQLVGALLIMKVVYYFGGVLEKQDNKLNLPLDYYAMARYIRTANFLDPYNMDLYYFTQATYSDSPKGARFIDELLSNGMKYRTWDSELPFFAGFNEAFTLKDYKKAAEYMKRAGEISRDPQYNTLAARFFNEAGESDFGILFMESMEKNARDEKIRRLYHDRKNLLIAVKKIRDSVNIYRQRYQRLPHDLGELLKVGLLRKIPRDPYGGKFYLTPDGKIESTSGSLSLRNK